MKTSRLYTTPVETYEFSGTMIFISDSIGPLPAHNHFIFFSMRISIQYHDQVPGRIRYGIR